MIYDSENNASRFSCVSKFLSVLEKKRTIRTSLIPGILIIWNKMIIHFLKIDYLTFHNVKNLYDYYLRHTRLRDVT